MARSFLLAAALMALASAGPIATTTHGPVEGVDLGGTHAFLGVPYASPPVGNRRWAAPVEPTPWTSPRNATAHPPGCPQVCVLPPGTCPETTSEDCLYLNVFTPSGSTGLRGADTTGLPVMFFIHGGRFEQGAIGTPLYDGRYLTRFGVVVVEIQYRLGALGFLTTTDITGNYAILDQQLALRWARDNVAAFGGDPSQVTLFGQSAGAMSVAAHLVSPLSAGLFRAAIMESDPLVLRYRAQDDAQALGAKFVSDIGCPKTDSLACLLGKSADEVLVAQKAAQKHLNLAHILELFVPWVPTLGEVVPNEPMLAFAEGGEAWNHVPLMIGTVKEDARMFVLEAWNTSLSAFEYHAVATAIFGFKNEKTVVAMFPDETDNREPLSHLGTDFLFACAARNLALNAAENATGTDAVFQYRFDHVLSFNASWGPNYTFCMGRVCHGSELPFVFGTVQLSGFQPTQGELMLEKQMMSYWTNFAKTLNPNGPGLPNWPALDNATRTIQRLEADNIVPVPNLNHTQCDMFDSVGYIHG